MSTRSLEPGCERTRTHVLPRLHYGRRAQYTNRDVVAMEMGPHVAPANKNVAPGAKQLLIINISNYTVL